MKGNLLLGTARKKLGDVVFYRQDGEQRARAYVSTVSNPKTDAQVLTRLALASVAKATQGLEFIVNHSFQSVAYGETSVRHFRSAAMKVIRTLAVKAYEGGNLGLAPVVPYNGDGIVAAPYEVSRGSLASANFDVVQYTNGSRSASYATQDVYMPTLTKSSFVSITAAEVLSALGISVDSTVEQQQLTLLFLHSREIVAETSTVFYTNDLRWSRLNFNLDTLSLPFFTLVSGNSGAAGSKYRINSAVLDATRSNYAENLLFTIDEVDGSSYEVIVSYMPDADADAPVVAGFASIVSQYVNSAWQRSTDRMVCAGSAIESEGATSAALTSESTSWNDLAEVLAAMSGSVSSDWLLNRSLNTSSGSASSGGQGNRSPQRLTPAVTTMQALARSASGLVISAAENYDVSAGGAITLPYSNTRAYFTLFDEDGNTIDATIFDGSESYDYEGNEIDLASFSGTSSNVYTLTVARDGYSPVTFDIVTTNVQCTGAETGSGMVEGFDVYGATVQLAETGELTLSTNLPEATYVEITSSGSPADALQAGALDANGEIAIDIESTEQHSTVLSFGDSGLFGTLTVEITPQD